MKRISKKIVFNLFIINLFCTNAWALLSFEDATYPELAPSGRALAMGNAFICKVDDATSVLYNPAGLGTVRYPHFHLANFQVEFNQDWAGLSTSGELSEFTDKFTSSLDVEGLRKLMLESPGLLTHSRLSFLPNFTTRYFSMGYLFSTSTRATLGTETGAKFEFANRRDQGPYLGLNLSLFGGVIKIGAAGFYLMRQEMIKDVDKDTAIEVGNDEFNRGSGVIVNGGLKVTLPWAGLPTIAASIHNAFDQDFSSEGVGPPTKIRKSITAGISIAPHISRGIRMHIEANLKDINNAHPEVNSRRKSMLGVEFDIYRILFIRFGYGDGFGTAGAGVKSKNFEIDVSTYALDTTSNEFQGEQDRRFIFSFSTGL